MNLAAERQRARHRSTSATPRSRLTRRHRVDRPRSANDSPRPRPRAASPSGEKYLGNFFTATRTRTTARPRSTRSRRRRGLRRTRPAVARGLGRRRRWTSAPWSLPVQPCANAGARRSKNPTEAIFLSPDRGTASPTIRTGTSTKARDNQIEPGTWTVTVKAAAEQRRATSRTRSRSPAASASAPSRPRSAASSAQPARRRTFVCNDSAVVTVNEIANGERPGRSASPRPRSPAARRCRSSTRPRTSSSARGDDRGSTPAAASRSRDVDRWRGAGTIRFDSAKILLTDGTAPDPGNGVLDVRYGSTIRVDLPGRDRAAPPTPNKRRVNVGTVDCRTRSPSAASCSASSARTRSRWSAAVASGRSRLLHVRLPRPVHGRRRARRLPRRVPVGRDAAPTLEDVTVSLQGRARRRRQPCGLQAGRRDLRRPEPDQQPAEPAPDDPRLSEGHRHAPGRRRPSTPSFTIQVATSITGVPAGRHAPRRLGEDGRQGRRELRDQRETLNVDEVSFFYSTDFPTGGIESGRRSSTSTTTRSSKTGHQRSGNFVGDYFFETRCVLERHGRRVQHRRPLMRSPWNFDTNDGGFTSGIQNGSRPTRQPIAIAEWGEDKNFNNRLDGFCSGATDESVHARAAVRDVRPLLERPDAPLHGRRRTAAATRAPTSARCTYLPGRGPGHRRQRHPRPQLEHARRLRLADPSARSRPAVSGTPAASTSPRSAPASRPVPRRPGASSTNGTRPATPRATSTGGRCFSRRCSTRSTSARRERDELPARGHHRRSRVPGRDHRLGLEHGARPRRQQLGDPLGVRHRHRQAARVRTSTTTSSSPTSRSSVSRELSPAATLRS